ncbi:MAG: anti-sigma factor domain-containing protein [Candidatus Contubernalis sp.]|nr:anti-sigma factor domain-containing protein [Candidatus Contubernalis sp.]
MKKPTGMVLEISSQTVVLLTQDGQFLEVPRPKGNICPGEEIPYSFPQKRNAALLAAAAAVIIFFMFSSPYFGFPTADKNPAYGYIALDINPSIELSFNSSLEVMEFQGFNPEGEKLLEGLKTGENLFSSLEYLLGRAAEMNYLNQESDHNLIMLTLVNPYESPVSLDELESQVQETLTNHDISGLVKAYETDLEERQRAQWENVSLNSRMQEELEHKDSDLPINPHLPFTEDSNEVQKKNPEEKIPPVEIPENNKPEIDIPASPVPEEAPVKKKLPHNDGNNKKSEVLYVTT